MYKAGDNVWTPYGHGVVKYVRDIDSMVIVNPTNWVMAQNKVPTFVLNTTSVKKIDKQSFPIAKTFDEKFALIKANKDEGNKLFKDGKYDAAKDKYAETINNLNVIDIYHCISLYMICD